MPDGSPSTRPWAAMVRALLCHHGVEGMRADAEAALEELAQPVSGGRALSSSSGSGLSTRAISSRPRRSSSRRPRARSAPGRSMPVSSPTPSSRFWPWIAEISSERSSSWFRRVSFSKISRSRTTSRGSLFGRECQARAGARTGRVGSKVPRQCDAHAGLPQPCDSLVRRSDHARAGSGPPESRRRRRRAHPHPRGRRRHPAPPRPGHAQPAGEGAPHPPVERHERASRLGIHVDGRRAPALAASHHSPVVPGDRRAALRFPQHRQEPGDLRLRKLDASSRSEAIERAVELGLVDAPCRRPKAGSPTQGDASGRHEASNELDDP